VARGLVRTARPKQWVKNVLVFAAPAAGGGLDDGDVLLKTLLTFVAFCLVSSATYILNDVGDVRADRAHPTKRARPIASGVVPVRAALVAVVGLLILGLALAYAISWQLGALLTAYKALTIAYTFRLKHTAILDIVVVATGFAVRAISGGVAADITLSQWFLAVTCFGSLFMVAGKRHGELLHVGEGGATRKALTQYTVEYLRFVVTMAASVTILTYCLWAFEHPKTSEIPWWGLSIVPFVMGIMRYALLVDQGKGGAPEELVIRDPGLRIIGLAWIALFLGSVYIH
jgi:decaprenyl-phosphate phosphoribosyltransferase